MKALILAGGLGTRLREVVSDRPKPMALIGGKPFLQYQIEQLRNSGIKDIVLSVGYMCDAVVDYFGYGDGFGVRLKYSIEEQPLGTGGAILKALPKLSAAEDFIVLNGDTLVTVDFMDLAIYHGRYSRIATIGATWAGCHNHIKPKNSGIYMFKEDIFSYIDCNVKLNLEKDILDKMPRRDYMYYEVNHFIDIGTPESYEKAQEVVPKWTL